MYMLDACHKVIGVRLSNQSLHDFVRWIFLACKSEHPLDCKSFKCPHMWTRSKYFLEIFLPLRKSQLRSKHEVINKMITYIPQVVLVGKIMPSPFVFTCATSHKKNATLYIVCWVCWVGFFSD